MRYKSSPYMYQFLDTNDSLVYPFESADTMDYILFPLSSLAVCMYRENGLTKTCSSSLFLLLNFFGLVYGCMK